MAYKGDQSVWNLDNVLLGMRMVQHNFVYDGWSAVVWKRCRALWQPEYADVGRYAKVIQSNEWWVLMTAESAARNL